MSLYNKISSWLTPGRESSVLMKPPVFSYHVRKFFAKIPTTWLKFIISRKKKFPKGLMGHLNAVLTYLPNFAPHVHNPSRNFHCSKNIITLIAKPWAGGIQLWRTSRIFSRNPEIYRQKRQNDKFFTPTGQIVFAYNPNVMTKSYTFFPKIFFRQIVFWTNCIHVQKPCREKNLQKCEKLTLLIQKKIFEKIILP